MVLGDQRIENDTIVISSVTVPEGGFVTVHDETLLEGDALGSVVGSSVYLEPGTHEGVRVTLAQPIDEDQALIAMPHMDTNGNEVYDFVMGNGTVDVPYTADGEAVVDEAEISVGAPDVPTEPGDSGEQELPNQVVFHVEELTIDQWSFVLGDSTEPDRTETISGADLRDETVRVNVSALLEDGGTQDVIQRGENATEEDVEMAVNDTAERVQDAANESDAEVPTDLDTVRVVVQDVTVENVTFVVELPESVQVPAMPGEPGIPEQPLPELPENGTTTTEGDHTTTAETTTPETTAEADTTTTPAETTTTPEETTTTTPEGTTPVETTTPETTTPETTTPGGDGETTTPGNGTVSDLGPSFDVEGLEAPLNATIGETIEVNATVTNPTESELTQPVDFRLDGTVVERQNVTLGAGESQNVSFQIETDDVEIGTYTHGVYTRNFGELAVITLEPADEGGMNETTTANETTVEETTTPETAAETTTPGTDDGTTTPETTVETTPETTTPETTTETTVETTTDVNETVTTTPETTTTEG